MSLHSRVEGLMGRHSDLEKMIEQETARPSANVSRIAELKKKKLLIKDEIERLSRAEPANQLH